MTASYGDLINPEDIVVLDDESLAMTPPDYLIKLTRNFRVIERDYPWLIPYLESGEPIPLKVLATNA